MARCKQTRASAGKKSIYRGVVDYVKLEIKSGAKYGTHLPSGESHGNYERTKLAIGFVGDDGENYWFRAPEINIPPSIVIAETAWLTMGDQITAPTPTIAEGNRIAVSAAVKATGTSHGTQLYYAARLDDDRQLESGGGRLKALEDRILALESRSTDLERRLIRAGVMLHD